MKQETRTFLIYLCVIAIFFLIGIATGKKDMEKEVNDFIIEEYYSMGYGECIEWCNGYEGTSIQYNGEIVTPFSKEKELLSFEYDGVEIE